MRATVVFTVLCATLGVLDALPFNTLTATVNAVNAPKPCCLPDQLEFTIGESIPYSEHGKGGLTTVTAWVAVDYKAKKMAVNELVYADGQAMNLTSVADFNNMEMYVVDWAKEKCTKTKLPSKEMTGQCLPEDAKYMGTIKFGLGQTISANQWLMYIKDEKARLDVQVYITMTTDTCVPVSESVIGSTGDVTIAAGIGYWDFKDSIRDPSVFDVPAICKKEGVQVVENLPMKAFQNYLVHKQHALK